MQAPSQMPAWLRPKSYFSCPAPKWLGRLRRQAGYVTGNPSRFSGRDVQATFCRRRHQPSRPPPASLSQSSLVESTFFGQGPQPPLGSCAPKICSLKPLPLEAQFHSDRARSEQSLLSFVANRSSFLIGELLLGKLSETVVVQGNAPHDRPGLLVGHLIGNRASFLCTKAPMLRIPDKLSGWHFQDLLGAKPFASSRHQWSSRSATAIRSLCWELHSFMLGCVQRLLARRIIATARPS